MSKLILINRNISKGFGFRLLLLVLLAFGFRLAVYLGRIANDPTIQRMASASDMAIYIEQARRLLAGTWPTGAFGYQPGNSFWLAGLLTITDDNLYGAVVITMLLGALSIVLIVYATAVLSASYRIGLLAGVLLAFHPVTAFYETTLLIAPAAAIFASVTLLFMALLHRDQRWYWAVAAGIVIGISSYFRTTMVALIPAAIVAIWLAPTCEILLRNWAKRLILSIILVVSVGAALAPGIAWNSYHLEEFSLPNTVGPLNLYRGNNRDATGINANSQAYYIEHSRGQDWTEAFVQDVRAEPDRWFGLLLRKFSLFWRDGEIPNMFNFYENGLASAYLLRLTPLGFGLLAFLAFFGVILTLPKPHPIWIPFTYTLTYSLLTALILVVGRYRIPVIPALAMASAMAIQAFFSQKNPTKLSLKLSSAVAVAVCVFWIGNIFPRPRFLPSAQLPEGYIPTDLTFGDDITLLGYQLESDTFYEDDWMIATLIWQASETPDKDYSVFLHLIEDDGDRVGMKDLVIGTVSYPSTPTTQWQPGTVFMEEVAINIGDARQIPASPTLWVGVYDKQTLVRLPISDSAGSNFENNAAALGEFRVIREQLPPDTEPVVPTDVVLANAVTLYGYTLQNDVLSAGEATELSLYWDVSAQIPNQVSILIHLVDEAGRIVAQADGAPLGGLLNSLLWRPGDRWQDDHMITVPPDVVPGEYLLLIGMYDWQSGERLSITQDGGLPASNNTLQLQTISVTGDTS